MATAQDSILVPTLPPTFFRCHASGKFPELEELCDQFATFNVDEATKNTVMEYDMVFASPWQAGQR